MIAARLSSAKASILPRNTVFTRAPVDVHRHCLFELFVQHLYLTTAVRATQSAEPAPPLCTFLITLMITDASFLRLLCCSCRGRATCRTSTEWSPHYLNTMCRCTCLSVPCSACLMLQLSRPRDQQDLHRLVRMGMWTKLRPGVRDFLRRAAERFELWIYTAGSRTYADVSSLVPS